MRGAENAADELPLIPGSLRRTYCRGCIFHMRQGDGERISPLPLHIVISPGFLIKCKNAVCVYYFVSVIFFRGG